MKARRKMIRAGQDQKTKKIYRRTAQIVKPRATFLRVKHNQKVYAALTEESENGRRQRDPLLQPEM